LARSNRQVAVVDSGRGRSTYRQVNHNYLGFPGGIGASELRELGRKQVAMYPVAFLDDEAASLRAEGTEFRAGLASGRIVQARTIILATGVTDDFPKVPNWADYVGRSLFWCIVCDGYAARGKRILAVGDDDEAAVTALQFLQFTPAVSLLTGPDAEISRAIRQRLRKREVPVLSGEIARFLGDDGILCSVVLRDETEIPADFVFSLQGSTPNNTLAEEAGAALTPAGYVVVDEHQASSVPGLFAAGDVSNRHSHQVATAVHEGLTAATAAHYHLLAAWQRE
jgi:thioredoxin reductase (NADPH)